MFRLHFSGKMYGGLVAICLLMIVLLTFHNTNSKKLPLRQSVIHKPVKLKQERKPGKSATPIKSKVPLPVSGKVSPIVTQNVTANDYRILVRLIHAEAGGETLRGQVAVGAVIINRIRSGLFPKTISGNVFKNGEFESVSNGYIWSNPTASAYRAARLALKGWDPSCGALYFYNPAKTYSTWIWSRPIIAKIGRHFFAG